MGRTLYHGAKAQGDDFSGKRERRKGRKMGIKLETYDGCIGKYLRAFLTVGSVRIDLGEGDSMNEGEAKRVADELYAAANEINRWATRNGE